MKTRSIILIAALMFTISPQCIYAGDNPIIGEWVSAKRSKGGLGGSKYFYKDGTLIVSYGALIDYKYKIMGKILYLYSQGGELTSEEEFKISESNLHLKNIKTGQVQKLTRVEGENLPSIIGKWVGENDTGKKYCMHFTQNMNCYFSVPFEKAKAQYEIAGNDYFEVSPQKFKTEWKYKINGDLLILTKKDGSKVEEYIKKK